MRIALITIILGTFVSLVGCGGGSVELTPLDTLKKYVQAVKDKDLTEMKLLLSEATLKLHTDQAKAQNVTLDEIVQRETLFPPDQNKFNHKPAKIEGNKATVEVENNFGGWDQIFLVKENGVWKIDKKGTAQQMIDEIDTGVQDLDDQMDAERKKTNELLDQDAAANPVPSPTVDPMQSPADADSGMPPASQDLPGSPPQISPDPQD
jgi:hypothetical protein